VRLITGLSAIIAALSLPFVSHAADPYETLSVIRQQIKAAPDFSLPQVNGKVVRLSDYKGKVVLLGFFKTF